MKKIILLVFAMIMAVLYFAFFVNSFPISSDINRTGNESCGNVINFTTEATASGGICQVTANNKDARYIMDLDEGISPNNISLLTKIRVVSCDANQRILSAFRSNSSSNAELDWRIREVSGGLRIHSAQTVDTCTLDSWKVDNTWHYLRVTSDSRNNKVTVIVDENSSNMCTIAKGAGFSDDFWTFGDSEGQSDGCVVDWDNMVFINGSVYSSPSPPPPDTTPPNILHYNLSTPSGDCTVWNTSKSTPCSTGDTTPTIVIKTDDDANCAIGLLDKNFTYYNNLSINRSCENGGTKSLICTLMPDDERTYEDATVYIGCRNTNGYENATSTSGNLSIQITGLQQGTRAAIGVGVQNALLSGYTNYTSQQIYARKLDGTQKRGTFDWVAKKGSKVWAFNYITKGESHIGMFNMSPSLYVLEMSNITNSTIINLVETMINGTNK